MNHGERIMQEQWRDAKLQGQISPLVLVSDELAFWSQFRKAYHPRGPHGRGLIRPSGAFLCQISSEGRAPKYFLTAVIFQQESLHPIFLDR